MPNLKHTAVQTPKGTKDFLPADVKRKRFIQHHLTEFYESYGYQEIITPTIEFYNSLTQGNGPHLAESTYRLIDQEGQILALRPDATTPIARVVATRYREAEKPLRFFYASNVLRYGTLKAGRRREFYQIGAELIGQPGPGGDSEIIALAIGSLQAVGLRSFRFDLGHVEFFTGLVEAAQLSPAVGRQVREALLRKDYVSLKELVGAAAMPDSLRQVFQRLPKLRGGKEVLKEAWQLAPNATSRQAVANLQVIYQELEAKGLAEFVQLDLGLVKDLDYYTGLIFEGYTQDLGFNICDGGRYDNLIGQFGYQCPATGFAFGVERLMECLDAQGTWPQELAAGEQSQAVAGTAAEDVITIAVPKGRLQKYLAPLLSRAGVDCSSLLSDSRKLIIETDDGSYRFLLAKPSDVPTYVEYGAADIGIVGKDILLETEAEVAELLDLGFGRCQMIVAVAESSGITDVRQLDFNSRVASKFTNIATKYFNQVGIQAEVIKLNGSVELGPIVGLADAIVDITETGTTLRANGLIPIATVAEISARLIANPISYKVKYQAIQALIDGLSGELSQ
ncbi:MAG: ATP phosphoribosyltransferase regulatory subunit [Firmicutes bacterium]|nr:ATP phosphoribosyltransferase regulatory subunit [Bacillota bacterium]